MTASRPSRVVQICRPSSVIFNCMLTFQLHVDGNLYITVMALVEFSASAVQALTYQNGDYMGSLNKKASDAQCFIMVLGLLWDIVTDQP